MPDKQKLPTAEEQTRRFQRDYAAYLKELEAWRENGESGPRPPRPVAPHAPGWKTSTADELREEESDA